MAASFTQKARDRLMKEHPDLQARLDLLRNLWRFDPEKDLHGITVYGTRLKKDTGVAVIHAQVNQKLLLDLAKAAPDHEVTTYGQYELHTWRKDAHKLDHAAFFKPDVLVFGASLDELKAALDVLNGTKPNYAAANEKLLDLSPSGAIFVAGARDISSAEVPHESPLVKHAESFLLVLGENQGQAFLRASLTMKDAQIAKQIKTAADGALAVASLMKIDDPDALKIIDAVKVTLDDKSVSVEGRAPVEQVWARVQKEIDKKKAESPQRLHTRRRN